LSVCLFVRSCLRWSLTRTAVVCRRVVLGNLSRTVRHWTTSKCEQGFAFCGCRFLPSQEPQRALTTVVHTDNGPAVPTRLLTDHTRPKRRRGVRLAPRDPAGARCQCTRYGDRKRTSDISNWTHLNTVEWRLMRNFSTTFANLIVASIHHAPSSTPTRHSTCNKIAASKYLSYPTHQNKTILFFHHHHHQNLLWRRSADAQIAPYNITMSY